MLSKTFTVALTGTSRIVTPVTYPRGRRPYRVQVTFGSVSGTGTVLVDMSDESQDGVDSDSRVSLDDGTGSDVVSLTNGTGTAQPGFQIDASPVAIGLTPTSITSATAFIHCIYAPQEV